MLGILRLIRQEISKGAQQKGYKNTTLWQGSFGKWPVEAFRVDKSLVTWKDKGAEKMFREQDEVITTGKKKWAQALVLV